MSRHARNTLQPAYESADISSRPILAAMLVMLLVLAGVLALLAPWRHETLVTAPPAQAGPALSSDPAAALARFRAEKQDRLAGYGWIDKTAGEARIPVKRAVELLLTPDAATAGTPEPAK